MRNGEQAEADPERGPYGPHPMYEAEPRPWAPGDPPLRRVPDELGLNTPAGRAARALGRQVRAWRRDHGVTQRELAERLGWEQPRVARLEGGGVVPSYQTLQLLADRLELRITLLPKAEPVLTAAQAEGGEAAGA